MQSVAEKRKNAKLLFQFPTSRDEESTADLINIRY